MQRTILALALLAITATSVFANLDMNVINGEMKELWNTWKVLNNKVYSEVEEIQKFSVFVENYFKVVAQNAKDDDVKFNLNQFADLTGAEFKAKHVTGLKVEQSDLVQPAQNLRGLDWSVLALPASVDWRAKGAVTPVKNQQQCGSCWAFSSTGALEGLNFIDTGKLLSFSEQQLVDCDTVDQGCNGGLMKNAFTYTAKKGIETEQDYPYTAAGGKCQYNAAKAVKVNSNSKSITPNNANALKTAIVAQPVSIAIEADQDVFQFYSSGVIKSNCGANLDHGVLAVGYQTVNGQEAFIVKNSWAASWGNQGYVYISTNGKPNGGAGVCGILSMPIVPLK